MNEYMHENNIFHIGDIITINNKGEYKILAIGPNFKGKIVFYCHGHGDKREFFTPSEIKNLATPATIIKRHLVDASKGKGCYDSRCWCRKYIPLDKEQDC